MGKRQIKLGVVMDPIEQIQIKKDSTFAMLLAAQSKGWSLRYIIPETISLKGETAYARLDALSVTDHPERWFMLESGLFSPLTELDVILMRKDPPFNLQYLYLTYFLEQAERQGVLVINRPESLRSANEKLFITRFPECIPETLVTSDNAYIIDFVKEYKDVILKPLDSMGGHSVFRVRLQDPNLSVICETLTIGGQRAVMAQRYLPEISTGDKRILLIDGECIPYALLRIPKAGETRANLAQGGRAKGIALDDRDRWICQQVGPILRDMDLVFVGLDVIGQYLTEINVTSPTCIRELDAYYDLDIAGQLIDVIERKLTA